MIKNRGPLPLFLKILKSFYFQVLIKFCKNYIYINFSWKLGQNYKKLQIQKKIVWKIVWIYIENLKKKIPIESPTSPLKFWNLHLLSDFYELCMKHLCLNFGWKWNSCWGPFPPRKFYDLHLLSDLDEILYATSLYEC